MMTGVAVARTEFEPQDNGDFWRVEYREDGSEMARFYQPAKEVARLEDRLIVVDHERKPVADFTGELMGHIFDKGVAPLPPPDPIVIKRVKLAELRSIGWEKRTADQDKELDGLARDLGA